MLRDLNGYNGKKSLTQSNKARDNDMFLCWVVSIKALHHCSIRRNGKQGTSNFSRNIVIINLTSTVIYCIIDAFLLKYINQWRLTFTGNNYHEELMHILVLCSSTELMRIQTKSCVTITIILKLWMYFTMRRESNTYPL